MDAPGSTLGGRANELGLHRCASETCTSRERPAMAERRRPGAMSGAMAMSGDGRSTRVGSGSWLSVVRNRTAELARLSKHVHDGLDRKVNPTASHEAGIGRRECSSQARRALAKRAIGATQSQRTERGGGHLPCAGRSLLSCDDCHRFLITPSLLAADWGHSRGDRSAGCTCVCWSDKGASQRKEPTTAFPHSLIHHRGWVDEFCRIGPRLLGHSTYTTGQHIPCGVHRLTQARDAELGRLQFRICDRVARDTNVG